MHTLFHQKRKSLCLLDPSLKRHFGQTERQRERKYRGGLNYGHKDFTKNSNFTEDMKNRKQAFLQRVPYMPLSKMAKADRQSVSRKRRPFFSTSPQLNPKIMGAMNRAVSKQAGGTVDDIWAKEGGSLRDKFFVLDHTAEVLENYRRIQENELFNRVLFEEREKKAFLKKEARKTENIIGNYE